MICVKYYLRLFLREWIKSITVLPIVFIIIFISKIQNKIKSNGIPENMMYLFNYIDIK